MKIKSQAALILLLNNSSHGFNITAISSSPSISCEEKNEYLNWDELSLEVKQHCQGQGWNEDKWEEGWTWDELTDQRKRYWISKNITQDVWETTQLSWDELSPDRQQYWEYIMGLNQTSWENTYMMWDELSPDRQQYYHGILNISSMEEWEGDWTWEELSEERRQLYKSRGWTPEAWAFDDKSMLKMYNEEEMEWEELSEDRRNYWIMRGWDRFLWKQSSVDDETPEKFDPSREFNPRVIRLSIPELRALDSHFLETIEERVGFKDGTTLGDNESFFGSEMSLREYMAIMKQDQTKLYFQLEDLDHYKNTFQSILGDRIIRHLYNALVGQSSLGDENNFFKPEWKSNMFDWALFVGSTNTTTSMHYDTDLFNFLYTVEGRKRIVMIPNNRETKRRYEIRSAYSGSGWTGLDILNKKYQLPDDAVVVEIGPGEGLVFPYLCWHAVENLEPTVAYGLRVKDD